MKFRGKIYVLVIAVILPVAAIAEEFYVGMDLGKLKFDQVFLADAENFGLTAGYNWKNWGIEGVLNFNETKSDMFGGDQVIKMYHLYGIYQTAGQYYLKAKIGLTNERYAIDNGEGQEVFDDVHSGVARGIGVGVRYRSVKSELEYTWLGGSLQLLTLGVSYRFK